MQVPEPIGTTLESLQQQVDDFSVPQAAFQNTMNVVRYGSVSITVPGTDTLPITYNASTPHGLGYIPAFISFVDTSGLGSNGQFIQMPAIPYSGSPSIWGQSDAQNFTVYAYVTDRHSTGDQTITVKYYLFREPAQPTTG